MHKLLLVPVLALFVAATAVAQTPTEADLVRVIGTKKDGWAPVAFAKLKAKMTPADVAKDFPGADKVSKFGFVKLPAKGAAGVREYELYFAKDKATQIPTELQSVKIIFDPKLTDAAGFWDTLLKVCVAKYGPAKPEQVEKRLVTWIGPRFKPAQLVKFPERGGAVLQLQVSIP